MLSTLIALLCLGLYLSQRISSQMQILSKPIIWAKPNFMIPSGMPVIIWCQGTHKATEYELHFEGHLFALETPNPRGMTNKVKFSIQTMTSHTAGQYKCLYRSGEHWSEPSDPLDLVLTGDVGNTSLASTEQPSSPDSWKPSLLTTKMEFQKDLAIWDHTSWNLFRISLAFLVLVAVCLLAKDWLCKKRTPEGADRASSQECRSFRTQRSLDE
ncbi:natural cytotoxicity triggering receptor 1 isoform X3 [Rhinolophus ferrumequinum]|uniref:natural cytotoxicity triggering receptor 1 isoform X3 n=1 Tax=Rhinolophus ferrumequinum TaxID=59479 RepID=UPI00140F7E7D|nr:natural cytotoxicity triggering receptor 1 isoform X3 [Rhinolophus ferrumequinum]